MKSIMKEKPSENRFYYSHCISISTDFCELPISMLFVIFLLRAPLRQQLNFLNSEQGSLFQLSLACMFDETVSQISSLHSEGDDIMDVQPSPSM